MFIEQMNSEEIISNYTEWYAKEFGERKYQKVMMKVLQSNKIGNLLRTAHFQQKGINAETVSHLLHEIPYFIFSRKETVALAGLLILHTWQNKTNSEFKIWEERAVKFNIIKFMERLNLA